MSRRYEDGAKCTVVSLSPFEINEFKPGIYPGHFIIPPSDGKIPQVLIIGTSVYHVEIDAERTITVPNPSREVARSIVDDYLSSNLEFSVEEQAMPAVFWVEGAFSSGEIMGKFADKVEESLTKQTNWFQRLVTLADDDWERTRQHRFITNMQRHACKALGLDRPWVIVPSAELAKQRECFACRTKIHPETIVCPTCRAIVNPELYKTVQFAGAK